MMLVDKIFADDLRNLSSKRSLPWEECRDGVTVIIEPKPHLASDMRAFELTTRKFCHYRDWTENGSRARFFDHIDSTGDDVMMKARAMIAREIADGLWCV